MVFFSGKRLLLDLENHIASHKSILEKMDAATQQFMRLNAAVLDALKPSSRPYLLIHHNSSLMHRINELKIIMERLYTNRVLLYRHDQESFPKLLGAKPGVFSDEINALFKINSEIDNQIQLDFQSLFIFMIIALDEWARLASFILGFSDAKNKDFRSIAADEKKGCYVELWGKQKADILWLDIFTRVYRNKMVVHREQPWQLSHTRQTSQMDWNFFTPIAHGWIDKKELDEKRKKLHELSAKQGLDVKKDDYTLIFELLNQYAEFDQVDRDSIYKLAIEIGFGTPSFQSIAHRFVDFLNKATGTLIEIAMTDPKRINLGAPT